MPLELDKEVRALAVKSSERYGYWRKRAKPTK
jgi:hypothetical protein